MSSHRLANGSSQEPSHSSPNLETASLYTSKMDKCAVVRPGGGILFGNEKDKLLRQPRGCLPLEALC